MGLAIAFGGAFSSVRQASVDRAILNNLRQLEAAADQYYLENDTRFTNYDQLVGPEKYIKAIVPVAGENYRNIPLKQGYALAVRKGNGEIVRYTPWGSENLQGDDAIKENLRRLAAARDAYFMETGASEVRFDDLVGPEPTKYINSLPSVEGEDYRRVVLRRSVPLSIETSSGRQITLEEVEAK